MSNITIDCKNCGQTVPKTADNRCQNCNKYNWGWQNEQQKEQHTHRPAPAASPEPPTNIMQQPLEEYGWLVVHTEGRRTETYKLRKGTNTFGRPTTETQVNLQITGDQTVSRHHAQIEVKVQNSVCEYLLTDKLRQTRGGYGSLNGTYVNGKPERIEVNQILVLKDGDTIQVGKNIKLVLKTPETVRDAGEATDVVGGTDYTGTVLV